MVYFLWPRPTYAYPHAQFHSHTLCLQSADVCMCRETVMNALRFVLRVWWLSSRGGNFWWALNNESLSPWISLNTNFGSWPVASYSGESYAGPTKQIQRPINLPLFVVWSAVCCGYTSDSEQSSVQCVLDIPPFCSDKSNAGKLLHIALSWR